MICWGSNFRVGDNGSCHKAFAPKRVSNSQCPLGGICYATAILPAQHVFLSNRGARYQLYLFSFIPPESIMTAAMFLFIQESCPRPEIPRKAMQRALLSELGNPFSYVHILRSFLGVELAGVRTNDKKQHMYSKIAATEQTITLRGAAPQQWWRLAQFFPCSAAPSRDTKRHSALPS